jgi:hypothetical protein
MPTVRGCVFPDRLRYDVPTHLWYERLGDSDMRRLRTAFGSGQRLSSLENNPGDRCHDTD